MQNQLLNQSFKKENKTQKNTTLPGGSYLPKVNKRTGPKSNQVTKGVF